MGTKRGGYDLDFLVEDLQDSIQYLSYESRKVSEKLQTIGYKNQAKILNEHSNLLFKISVDLIKHDTFRD